MKWISLWFETLNHFTEHQMNPIRVFDPQLCRCRCRWIHISLTHRYVLVYSKHVGEIPAELHWQIRNFLWVGLHAQCVHMCGVLLMYLYTLIVHMHMSPKSLVARNDFRHMPDEMPQGNRRNVGSDLMWFTSLRPKSVKPKKSPHPRLSDKN